MSEPVTFPSATPVIGLPLLIAGQAQKEFFVNQALCLIDALHPRAVLASQSAPPPAAVDGACFRITQGASNAWSGHEGDLAVMIGGDWHFIGASEGMLLFDRTAGHWLAYRTQWESAAAPAALSGGAIIDTEARAAIATLVEALRTLGILAPASP